MVWHILEGLVILLLAGILVLLVQKKKETNWMLISMMWAVAFFLTQIGVVFK